ncbi:MAG: AraC family transcriptional regulator [Clostridia bacterium]|nr:AraC family transcriptional regulator [Clostridia bacterium]
MNTYELGVLDGRRFLGQDDFVIWDCYTEGNGIFDGKYHFHDFYELSYVYDGEGVYTVNGASFSVGRGFLFLTTPSDYHSLSVPKGNFLRYYNVIFRENLLKAEVADALYRQGRLLCFLAEGEQYESFLSLFQNMKKDYSEEAVDPIPPLTAVLVQNEIESICVRLIKTLNALPKREELTMDSEDAIIRRALLYIREHYRMKLTLARVADAVGLSPGYFSSYFHRVMKIGFAEYLLRFRLIMAASYMTSSNLPLKTVAAMNGFSSFTYFSSAFSAYFGVCPREYRKR